MAVIGATLILETCILYPCNSCSNRFGFKKT